MPVRREEAWRVALRCLAGIDEFQTTEDDRSLVDSVINARLWLRSIADGKDFGFEPLEWLSFLGSSFEIDDQIRELITYECGTPRFRRVRELVEEAVTKDPCLIHPDRFKERKDFFKERVLEHIRERREVPSKVEFDEWTALWESMNGTD